jgi:hypothetical protein
VRFSQTLPAGWERASQEERKPWGEHVIEYFGVDNKVLFSSFVPASPGDGSLSFFGIVFDDARIARVRITTGDVAPGPDDDGRNDIVVMDYAEPAERRSAKTRQGPLSDRRERSHRSSRAQNPYSDGQNGRGSGPYTAGTMVTVTTDAPPAGQQFADWTGDIQILANPAVATTTATMPSIEVTITATYRELPR